MINIDLNIDWNAIIQYLTSPELQVKLFPVKIVFFTIAGFFVGMIIFAILRTHYFEWLFLYDVRQFINFKAFTAKKMSRTWKRILRRLETGLASDYKLAIIEADDMLEIALKRMGYAGENFEERLQRLTSAILPNIEDVQKVHQIRNNIVRNPDYQLTLEEARSALDVYEKTFDSLEILV